MSQRYEPDMDFHITLQTIPSSKRNELAIDIESNRQQTQKSIEELRNFSKDLNRLDRYKSNGKILFDAKEVNQIILRLKQISHGLQDKFDMFQTKLPV